MQGGGSSEIEEIIKVEYSQEETVASAEEKKVSTVGDEETTEIELAAEGEDKERPTAVRVLEEASEEAEGLEEDE